MVLENKLICVCEPILKFGKYDSHMSGCRTCPHIVACKEKSVPEEVKETVNKKLIRRGVKWSSILNK